MFVPTPTLLAPSHAASQGVADGGGTRNAAAGGVWDDLGNGVGAKGGGRKEPRRREQPGVRVCRAQGFLGDWRGFDEGSRQVHTLSFVVLNPYGLQQTVFTASGREPPLHEKSPLVVSMSLQFAVEPWSGCVWRGAVVTAAVACCSRGPAVVAVFGDDKKLILQLCVVRRIFVATTVTIFYSSI